MYPSLGKRQSPPRELFNGALLHFLNRRYEYANKNRGEEGFVMLKFILVKPGLNIYFYSRNNRTTCLQPCSKEVLKQTCACDPWRPGFKFESCSENVEQRRFQRF